jgi:hypothetical protein
MRIINVLEIINGIPSQIESFPIWEEQLSQEVVDEAEKLFIQLCKAGGSIEFSDEEIEYILDEGQYDDHNGHEIYIIWSN